MNSTVLFQTLFFQTNEYRTKTILALPLTFTIYKNEFNSNCQRIWLFEDKLPKTE